MNNLNINKKVSLSLFFTFFLIMTVFQNINASTRIKELVDIKGINDHQIVGYSLVVGLDGTGRFPTLIHDHSGRSEYDGKIRD